MLARFRLWLAGVLAPELVRTTTATVRDGDKDAGEGLDRPEFDASAQSPLGLREVERRRSRKLEEVAEFLRDLDPESRDRIVAFARPKRTGRRQILPRHNAEMDGYYRNHPSG